MRSGRGSNRRWERELLREIRALEATDPEHAGHDVAPVTPITGRVRRPHGRARRRVVAARRQGQLARAASSEPERRRTLITLVITAVVIVVLGTVAVGPIAPHTRHLLGLDGLSGRSDAADYAFLHTDIAGHPAGFDPCDPIHFVVNDSEAPRDWEGILDDAVSHVEAATGLTFVYDGRTLDDGYFHRVTRTLGASDPVLVGWSDSSKIEQFGGDAIGLASSNYDPQTNRYKSGTVVLDSDYFNDLSTQVGGRAAQEAVIMHELGHLVGLDHVMHRDELMYPTAGYRVDYGAGDLEGLRRIGAIRC